MLSKLTFRLSFLCILILSLASCVCWAERNVEVLKESAEAVILGEVTEDGINVRTDSTIGSDIICKVNKGEQVTITQELYEWYKIRLPKQAQVYVKKELFKCIAFDKDCLKAQAIGDRINIRVAADLASSISGLIKRDEQVEVIEDLDAWYKIKPTDNTFGWIHKEFIRKYLNSKHTLE